ncbi:ABC transporter permease [Halalkalibacter sp. APA_J-10(15)]|uniref:ABC transporter permease n=1 Tax=Halalkalibacter sp. APA_J-10(15) TaxID=2933805 RepID=UPI001FF3401F|nr:ABC-2 family transporter protein [Halalkalibacter sp. APA_J-10(15)]MCK0473039.1 ABC-2 family transporter protein [Halalkalibacter sp. APA_J-10(15)]
MLRNLKTYFCLLNANLKTLVSFRVDFILLILSGSLTQLLGVIFIFTIFKQVPNIDGWSLYEIILIYSLVFLVEGLVSIFFDGIWKLTSIVNSGEFDRILLRPVSPIIQIATLGFGSQGIGNFIIGLILLVYSLIKLNLMNPITIFIVIIFVFLGVIIRAAINYCIAASSFWTKNGNPLMMANYSFSEFSKYPITIYSYSLQILIIVIPYIFISYVPVLFILKKEGANILLALYPFVILYCILCVNIIMKKGIKKYGSTGN